MFFQQDGVLAVEQGLLQGVPCQRQPSVYAFKGIPYAEPPVGELRWRPTQPVKAWEGIRDCSGYAPNFTQVVLPLGSFYQKEFYPTTRPMSEDGLYLNVWSGAPKRGAKQPVLIWIHGGAFQEGSGAALQFIGENLAAQGVVVVTINYRMGALGFMAHAQLTAESGFSGNYAFLDQLEAVRWVKKNISAFGGDPDNITIDGQSAGSMSVCALIASPLAKGLFQKAIAQSGSVFGRSPDPCTREAAEKLGEDFLKGLGVTSIEEARKLSSQRILEATAQQGVHFTPIVDGFVIPQPYAEIFRLGRQNPVAILAGSTNAEGCLHEVEKGDYAAYCAQADAMEGDKGAFIRLFPANNDAEAAKVSDWVRTSRTFAGMRLLAARQAQAGCPAYLYSFTQRLPEADGGTIGAFHSAELVYQFGTLYTGWRPWREQDKLLSSQMMRYWANFCRTGDPNGKELPTWSPFAPGAQDCMHLGENAGMAAMPYGEQVEFFTRLFER